MTHWIVDALLAIMFVAFFVILSLQLIEEDGETAWYISYRDFIAPLVASIKELKARIEDLEGK